MTPYTAQDAIDNQENTFSRMLEIVFGEQMKGIHTMLPGVIESFDAGTQRAKITLANAIERNDGTTVIMPPLTDVPVMFYRWGGFVITGPVTAGDECVILFSERALDRFKALGDTGQPPTDARFFNLSDGYCIPGTMSAGKALSGFNGTDLELRKADGSTTLAVGDASLTYTDGSVNLSINSSGVLTFTNGTTTFEVDTSGGTFKLENSTAELVDLLSQLLQYLSTETVIVAGTPTPFTGAANYTALKLLLDTLKA